MRFSVVAAAAVLATAVSAADYGYPAPSPVVVTKQEYVTVNCEKEPAKCPYGGHKPTTTKALHPTGSYGNVSHPIYTPTYPIVPKPPHGGDDDKYYIKTLTSTSCVPTTVTYTTKVLKPTTTPPVKPTGALVPVPSGGIVKPPQYTNVSGAGSLKMGSFAAVAGVAAFILA